MQDRHMSMSLKTRISDLEVRLGVAAEPELVRGLTASEAYRAILNRSDLIAVEDAGKSGTYRLQKTPPKVARLTPESVKTLTPEDAHRRLLGADSTT